MDYNPRTRSLVTRSLAEYRIRKWFKTKKRIEPSPAKLLSQLTKPDDGRSLKLTKDERMEFIGMIRKMYRTRNNVSKYRKLYGRRPKLFYQKVLGFPPREFQSVRVIWNMFNAHILFEKNDILAFWKRVQWGPGSGGYYPVGDTDVKIKELRGLISFGKKEDYSIETWDTMKHESVHAFEGSIKNRSFPTNDKYFMFKRIKSEFNAYIHNFKYSKKLKRRRVNMWARNGLAVEVREFIEEYLNYEEAVKRIENMKTRIRREESKKKRMNLRKRLKTLEQRLERKKAKKQFYFSIHRKTANQIKKSLNSMPAEAVQRIIYEVPFERLHKKLPEAVIVYRRMRYEWARNN